MSRVLSKALKLRWTRSSTPQFWKILPSGTVVLLKLPPQGSKYVKRTYFWPKVKTYTCYGLLVGPGQRTGYSFNLLHIPYIGSYIALDITWYHIILLDITLQYTILNYTLFYTWREMLCGPQEPFRSSFQPSVVSCQAASSRPVLCAIEVSSVWARALM